VTLCVPTQLLIQFTCQRGGAENCGTSSVRTRMSQVVSAVILYAGGKESNLLRCLAALPGRQRPRANVAGWWSGRSRPVPRRRAAWRSLVMLWAGRLSIESSHPWPQSSVASHEPCSRPTLSR